MLVALAVAVHEEEVGELTLRLDQGLPVVVEAHGAARVQVDGVLGAHAQHDPRHFAEGYRFTRGGEEKLAVIVDSYGQAAGRAQHAAVAEPFRSRLDPHLAMAHERGSAPHHEVEWAPIHVPVLRRHPQDGVVVIGKTERGTQAAEVGQLPADHEVADRNQAFRAEERSGNGDRRPRAIDHPAPGFRVAAPSAGHHAGDFDFIVRKIDRDEFQRDSANSSRRVKDWIVSDLP